MKNIFICPNVQRDQDLEKTRAIAACLEGRGARVCVSQSRNHKSCGLETAPDAKGFDLVVSIGGDGTFLSAAKLAKEAGIPVLGINLGTLGFMTELEACETELLERLFSGRFTLEKRMLLTASIIRGGKRLFEAEAINEAVLRMGDRSRILDITLYAGGDYVTEYRADGLLAATPTGSTGYALSAGGPIVAPEVNCVIVVPLCAHSLSSRPIVFRHDTKLSLALSGMKNKNAYLSVDGSAGVPVLEGDEMLIEESQNSLSVVKLSDRSFYEQLSRKMRF